MGVFYCLYFLISEKVSGGDVFPINVSCVSDHVTIIFSIDVYYISDHVLRRVLDEVTDRRK